METRKLPEPLRAFVSWRLTFAAWNSTIPCGGWQGGCVTETLNEYSPLTGGGECGMLELTCAEEFCTGMPCAGVDAAI